jgi:hypothetical protein
MKERTMSNRSKLVVVPLAATLILLFLGCASLPHSNAAAIQAVVDSVSQEQYTAYQLAIESMGLGKYGGEEYNMGFRCRDYDPKKKIFTPGNREACKYIKDQFEAMGIKTTLQGDYRNVLGEITGTKTPEKIYVFGAHYDHIKGDKPGGDDNASGTAALLEAARVLSRHTFESTIHLVAFNAEEDDLRGSKDYVNKVAKGRNVVGMINFDMILRPGSDAEPGRRIDFEIESDGATGWVVTFVKAVLDYVPSLPVGDLLDTGEDSWSDNDSFKNAGIPALLVIENSTGDWYKPNPVANPYYHHFEDASDRKANNPEDPKGVKYDYTFATDLTRGAVAVLAQEAGIVE